MLGYSSRFFDSISHQALNRDIPIEGTDKLLSARDDTHPVSVRKGPAVKPWAVAESKRRIPS